MLKAQLSFALYVRCCSSKTLLIQETISLLTLANKKVDEGRTGNMDTDNEDCISVVNAAMASARHPMVQQEAELSTPKQLMRDTPLDIDRQVASAVTDDPARTTVVPSSSNLDAETGGKLITRKHT